MKIRTDLNQQDKVALEYYLVARNYMWAAQMLPDSKHYGERAGGMVLPHYLLLSFCLELFLKSFLAKKGMSKGELKQPKMMHSLELLLECAKEKGFVAIEHLDELLSILHKQHAKHSYRYAELGTTYTMVNLGVVHEVLNQLDTKISEEIDANSMLAKQDVA